MAHRAKLRVFASVLFGLACGSAWAAGFGNLSFVKPASVSASADTGAFSSLLSKPSGVGVVGEFEALINGRAATISAGRLVSSASLVALSKGLAKFAGPVGLAWALADLVWDDKDSDGSSEWWKPSASTSYPPGLWLSTYHGHNYYADNPNSACASALASVGRSGGTSNCTGTQTSCGCVDPALGIMAYVGLVTACPAGQTWINGACTGVGWEKASDSELEQQIAAKVNASAGNAYSQGQTIISVQGPDGLVDAAGPINSTSGPSTVAPQVSTSSHTGPEGTTTTTTTSTQNITYSNTTNIVNITNTTNTHTVYPDASTSDTTDVEGSDAPDKNPPTVDFCAQHPTSAACLPPVDICKEHPEAAACLPPIDFCVEHPEASGCAPLDIPPVNEDLLTQDVPFEWAPTRTAAGSCPSPIELDVLGSVQHLKWDAVCDFATGIRPFVLIGSLLSAGMLLFGMVRVA